MIQITDVRAASYTTPRGTELSFRDSWKFNVAGYELARMLELVELYRLSPLLGRAGPRAALPALPTRPTLPASGAPPVLPVPVPPAQHLALPAPPPRGAAGAAKRLTTEEQAERPFVPDGNSDHKQ